MIIFQYPFQLNVTEQRLITVDKSSTNVAVYVEHLLPSVFVGVPGVDCGALLDGELWRQQRPSRKVDPCVYAQELPQPGVLCVEIQLR